MIATLLYINQNVILACPIHYEYPQSAPLTRVDCVSTYYVMLQLLAPFTYLGNNYYFFAEEYHS